MKSTIKGLLSDQFIASITAEILVHDSDGQILKVFCPSVGKHSFASFLSGLSESLEVTLSGIGSIPINLNRMKVQTPVDLHASGANPDFKPLNPSDAEKTMRKLLRDTVNSEKRSKQMLAQMQRIPKPAPEPVAVETVVEAAPASAPAPTPAPIPEPAPAAE